MNAQPSIEICFVDEDDFPLAGAYVSTPEGELRYISDESGCVWVSTIDSLLLVSYVGLSPKIFDLRVLQNGSQIMLKTLSATVSEILVKAKRNYGGSTAALTYEELKKIPLIFGERDPFRALMREPGISQGSELSARLFVRGGLPSQNLVLLDGVPVYNETHAGPIFSMFNGDVVKQIKVHKLTSPSEYGSGVSSLVEVTTLNPLEDDWKTRFSIGTIGSTFYTSGPVNKKGLSVQLGMRGTLPSLLRPILGTNTENNHLYYGLFDLNAAVVQNFNSKSNLAFRFFQTIDDGSFGQNETVFNNNNTSVLREFSLFKINWKNTGISATYQKEIGRRWLFKNQLLVSKYKAGSSSIIRQYEEDVLANQSADYLATDILHYGGRSWLYYNADKWNANIGLELKWQLFDPLKRSSQSDEESEGINSNLSFQSTTTSTAFAGLTRIFNDRHKVEASGRLNFHHNTTANIRFTRLQAWMKHHWKIGKKLILNTALEQSTQFEHGFSTVGESWQLNIWIPSDGHLQPQLARQMELNLRYYLNENLSYNTSVYFRHIQNISLAKEADLLFNERDNIAIETEFLNKGQAWNKGLENVINLTLPKLELGLSYTLSYTDHQFAQINRGEKYPGRFDRRHDLALWTSFKLNSSWSMNAQWIYQSGIAFSAPVARVATHYGGILPFFQNVNNARFPAVHRLDISLNREWTGRKGHSNELVLSIYNAYNNTIPFNVFASLNRGGGNFIADPPNLFGNIGPTVFDVRGIFGIIPSVTWRKNLYAK